MSVLVINCGSSSVKYQLIRSVTGDVLLSGLIEQVGMDLSYEDALADVLKASASYSVKAVGHRVAHGGKDFHDAILIEQTVIDVIEKCIPLAPLHNPANLAGIQAAMAALPDVSHVAVFDTAFHARLPRRASTYAIDRTIAEAHGIRRYGFHGTSHRYAAEKAAEFLQRPLEQLRIITLHLGNGCSACAVEFGHSTETSMGMTPLEGLVMGSRSGDVDAGVLLTLMREGHYSLDDVDDLLNRNSGLKGLSGISHDLRVIEASAAEGDDNARLAIAVFAHRVRKYVGAYAATMGGVDAVVFTGGIGENSACMRRRILQRFDFIGLSVDEDRNQDIQVSTKEQVGIISPYTSKVSALVVKANEELMIAKQTQDVIDQMEEQSHQLESLPHIPIAVSARHVHLSKETFKILFGDDATLSHYKDTYQQGQYAAHEKVNLVGPRDHIKGVRVLGPLRVRDQVEISRTDEFKLGVDAPVRDSGQLEGAAPIILEGPKGTVHLPEALICARRHIHMNPNDARLFKVSDKDEVDISVNSHGRSLVFGDVLVRVHPSFRLEMHIDTDEANAAELSNGIDGELVYTETGSSAALYSKRTRNKIT